MDKKIKKPLLAKEAQKKSVLVNSDTQNVQTLSFICNPSIGCSGARQLGITAADYFQKISGSELNYLEALITGLCTSCRVDILGGYFHRKDEIGGR